MNPRKTSTMARYRRPDGSFPPIAGGAPPATLKDALADLDREIEALTKAVPGTAAAAGDATETEQPAETESKAAGGEPDAAAQKLAEIAEREQALAETEKGLSASIANVTTLIKSLTEHGGSRFAGAGVSPEVAKAIAEGGAVVLGTGEVLPAAGGQAAAASIKVGVNKQVEAFKKSKQFSRFFASMKAVREGYASEAERLWMNEQKALAEATGSAGGYLIPPDWMPDILQLFRGVTVIRRARPGIMQPFTAQMNQVGLTGGATAYYTAENAAIPTSQPAINQTTLLTPKNLTGLVPASNWLLIDSRRTDVDNDIQADAETLIRQDLAVVMALKEDKNFLFGNPGTETGSPTGLVNISGIVTNPIAPGANGFQPTLPQLRYIKNYPRRFNLPNPRWTWFFHSEFLSYIEGLTDSLGRFLADAPNLLQVDDEPTADATAGGSLVGAGAGVTGRLLNIPFFASNQIPANLTLGTSTNTSWLLLVDMNQLVVGLNRDMVIESSSEAAYTPDGGTTWISAFQNNQTLFKATLRHDINHRYPNLGVIQQSGVIVT